MVRLMRKAVASRAAGSDGALRSATSIAILCAVTLGLAGLLLAWTGRFQDTGTPITASADDAQDHMAILSAPAGTSYGHLGVLSSAPVGFRVLQPGATPAAAALTAMPGVASPFGEGASVRPGDLIVFCAAGGQGRAAVQAFDIQLVGPDGQVAAVAHFDSLAPCAPA